MHGALPSPPLRFPTSSGYFVLDVNMSNSSWTRQDAEPVPQYDQRGRLQPFVETAAQRRVRQQFLRKRGLSKRISAWLEESEQSHTAVPEVSTSQRPSLAPSRSSSSSSLRTIDEEEEPEPEIFYSTAPATPSVSSWWALPPSFLSGGNGASLASRFGPRARHTRTSSFSSRSTSSSLSSISESEED